MENFEYSIQLNDRDWAEFCLASEECGSVQASLATAEQALSDLEEGEAEGGRLVRVRVGHSLARCSSRGIPQGQLLAEDLQSGSEDETDLDSVSRFLCSNHERGVAFSQEGQLPSVTFRPPGGQRALAEPHAEREMMEAAKEAESERGRQHINPACPLPSTVAASAVQGEDLQEQTPDQEALKQSYAEHQTLYASEPMERPARERQNRPSCLELSTTTDGSLQDAPAETQKRPAWTDSTTSARNPESPGSSELPGWVPSSVPKHPDSAESLGENTKALPVAGRANEVAADLRGKRQVCRRKELHHGNPKEEGQVELPTWASKLQQVSGGNTGPGPAQTADTKSEEMSDRREQTAEKREYNFPLGTAVPCEKERYSGAHGEQKSDFFDESRSCGPASEGSPESKLTAITWPEMYDSFFCEDTQEEGETMGTETRKEKLVSDPDQELPRVEGPEMYEYFFCEMDTAQVGEGRRDAARTVDIFLSSENEPAPPSGSEDMYFSVPEVYEHFFAYSAKDQRNWKGFFLRMPGSEARKAIRALKSLLSKPARFFKPQPVSQGALLRRGSHGQMVLLSPRLIRESHPRPEELGMALMQPERPLKPVFTHRDMCLGFLAFASWAVKTSDLQAPDAWKIVLLANFGTLSAIRFLRRHVVMEGHHGS